MERFFLEYGILLKSVSSFRYLGQRLSSTDDDWKAVERNLQRAQVNEYGWQRYW